MTGSQRSTTQQPNPINHHHPPIAPASTLIAATIWSHRAYIVSPTHLHRSTVGTPPYSHCPDIALQHPTIAAKSQPRPRHLRPKTPGNWGLRLGRIRSHHILHRAQRQMPNGSASVRFSSPDEDVLVAANGIRPSPTRTRKGERSSPLQARPDVMSAHDQPFDGVIMTFSRRRRAGRRSPYYPSAPRFPA